MLFRSKVTNDTRKQAGDFRPPTCEFTGGGEGSRTPDTEGSQTERMPALLILISTSTVIAPVVSIVSFNGIALESI